MHFFPLSFDSELWLEKTVYVNIWRKL